MYFYINSPDFFFKAHKTLVIFIPGRMEFPSTGKYPQLKDVTQ